MLFLFSGSGLFHTKLSSNVLIDIKNVFCLTLSVSILQIKVGRSFPIYILIPSLLRLSTFDSSLHNNKKNIQ